MSTRPLITTIITCYNKAPWIEQCIRSVLSQSIADSEVLVIDDASTDGSVEIVRRLEAENTGRLRTIFHRENKGLPVTWREAVALPAEATSQGSTETIGGFRTISWKSRLRLSSLLKANQNGAIPISASSTRTTRSLARRVSKTGLFPSLEVLKRFCLPEASQTRRPGWRTPIS